MQKMQEHIYRSVEVTGSGSFVAGMRFRRCTAEYRFTPSRPDCELRTVKWFRI